MRQCLALILVLLANARPGHASCIDPSALVRSTVGITREFTEEERKSAPGILGIRGTGWFLSARAIVTAAHVAGAMQLSAQDWRTLEVRERESTSAVPARLVRIVGADAEKIAVIELEAGFPNAVPLPIRIAPLVPDEPVSSLAYPDNRLRLAKGRFVAYGVDAGLAGAALLEMHDGSDRLVLDHGASGAPIVDCEGRVVAVVSTLITQTINLPTGAARVSTAWQTPNVVSMRAEALKDFSSPQ